MSSKSIFVENIVTYNTIIEINDKSNDFISYWDLAMKDHLSNNYIIVGEETNKSGAKLLKSFQIKLVDQKQNFSPERTNLVQLDKLFIIDVYRIRKEKDFNKDFINYYKANHSLTNFNVILYNIDEFKDNTLKNITKIYEKIKSKTGLADFSFIPYNEKLYGKFYSVIDNFFLSLKTKIAYEYNNRLKIFSEKLDNMKDIYNSDEDTIYEYIKNKILYIDLLSMGEFWDDIKQTCFIDLNKIFDNLNPKFVFKNCYSFEDLNIMEIKQKAKNRTLTNIEFQLFILFNYIKSCRYLKEYSNLVNCMCNSSIKLNIYESSFKSKYHYYFWKINFIFNFINYLIAFQEKKTQKDFDYKNHIEQGILHLYSLVSKEIKIYGKNLKIELPSIKIFTFLKDCIDKGMNIKEELDKIMSVDLGDIEKDEIFTQFKSDIKTICERERNRHNLFKVFTNKKAFIEEYLLIYQMINKRNCELLKCKTSIREAYDIIPLLISLNKLEEAKNILNSLYKEKFVKSNKWNITHQYICLILVMLLHCLEKNKDNLKIMFKLLDTNFSKLDYFLKILESKDENMINDIISKYIESFSDIELEKINNNDKDDKDKSGKMFSLDKTVDIKLDKIKDNIIFINKTKTKKEQIKYKFTNNTGISVNIDKIQLIFEELSSENDKKDEKNKEEKKQITYEIDNNSNTFKSILPFMKDQENVFEIIVDESNDTFKLNTMYKFKEIKYIIKNSLCGVYHIKEDIIISINPIDMKISTQIFPSYDANITEFNDEMRNIFYFNTLSKININLIDIPSPEEMNNKSLKINIEHLNKKEDTNLIIQTQVLKEKINKIYPDAIIDNYSIELPPGSLKDKEKLENIIIPFYVENINFYSNAEISMKINVHIFDKSDNDKVVYSYLSFHSIKLVHLFNIRKKFRLLKNNTYLMQATFSLNLDGNNVKIFTRNSTNYSFYMDASQAINFVLVLGGDQNEIIKKLRQNFLEFSIEDETIKNKEEPKLIKYRLCYPEKNIIEEIKELTQMPYHIFIDIEEGPYDIFKEINVNINIRKNNKKKVLLLTHIKDSEKWAILGKTKVLEEWYNDEQEVKNNEKNISVKLLPLVDGFVKLPEIEFLEYEIKEGAKTDKKSNEDKIDKLKIDFVENSEDEKEDIAIGDMNFDPIEFGTVIEGNEKVLKIKPTTECALKLNLT